jgi:NTP pyrophosphatase (non-canonical NTP hydrolase)
MSDIKEFTKKILAFRDAREWKQFHNVKDMMISLSLEAAELLEHAQWKNEQQLNQHITNHKSEVADELADVFYWTLLIANDLNIDLIEAANNKLKKNEQKYPIEQFKGQSTKYNKI